MVRWEQGRRSENVEDRRGQQLPRAAVGGGGAILVAIIIFILTGGDLNKALNFLAQQQPAANAPAGPAGPAEVSPEEQRLFEMASVILGDTEDVWSELFPQFLRRPYQPCKMVIFSEQTVTGCGVGQAAMGPFYCPADQKVYLDLAFFDELDRRFGAPGDFAQAYVIAHEVGHHVQNVLGISEQIQRAQQRLSEAEGNQLSVRLELQADYLAGVWAHHAQKARNILEQGDVEEGLRAANAIGDDTLQKQATGRVVQEKFTHGTSAQRVRWFKRGMQTGKVSPEILEEFFTADEL
jgi:predicted metalloprotease